MSPARRVLHLAAALCATLALASAGPVSAAAAGRVTPVIRAVTLGHSVKGRPIIAYELGNPSSRVKALLLGEMHGDEHAGVTVARALISGNRAITNIDLWVVPTMNPDGYVARTRQNAHRVDLNRNWPDKWARLSGMYYSGKRPLSEPETRAMYSFLKRLRPRYVVSLHQPLHGVDTTDGGATNHAFRHRLARNLGLPEKPFRCWSVCHGSMTAWFTHHLPGSAITVEFGSGPSRSYLTGRAARGIVTAMGGGFASLATRNPFGHLDRAEAAGSTVHVSGWTLDPDMKTTSLTVTITDNGKRVATTRTSQLRQDVNRRYAATGKHGYSAAFAARNGSHTVCVTQINVGAGAGNTKACRTVTVNGSPT